MAKSNDLLIKQRSVIEFLAAEGCSAANIHARMKTVYGEMCISDCAVRKWVGIFKGEDLRETIPRDRKRSGGPLSASVTAHREKVDCMIRANRRVKQKEIANAVGISKERVHHIVTTVLVWESATVHQGHPCLYSLRAKIGVSDPGKILRSAASSEPSSPVVNSKSHHTHTHTKHSTPAQLT
ncbi:histone-lysine N-methyltransferase SETMAR-like protein [Plakobranchus ocellatus]|uniref:Histone-lysine N-methyltransferase SETMAR-like protein n=1 Tax=Plakobranchus ocellatus TaxID=259542 RepID=A0AAV4DN75_9GAST|nr:histone-lysine N-methyltransferase SETMAR-like protein [Plakobranchus ocellatus]